MGIKGGLVLAACPLLVGQASTLVSAFAVAPTTRNADRLITTTAGRGYRLFTGNEVSSRLPLSRSSTASTEHSKTDHYRSDGAESDSDAVRGPVRATAIATEARRRAREARREARRETRSRASVADEASSPALERLHRREKSLAKAFSSPAAKNSRQDGVPPPPPSLQQAARPSSRVKNPRLAEEEFVEANDEKARRVREILDAYLIKVPTSAQWPPSRRIRVRGVEIHYKDTGRRGIKGAAAKDRPTFMLLHGLAGSTASWDEVIGDLAEYGRVISFDRPGFGKTERVMPPAGLPWRLCPQTWGENPYSANFAAKALFGILDRLGIDKVILVAHSLGAQVALRAARARPGTIRAMILAAPAVLNPLDAKFVMGRDPSASLFSPVTNLKTRVEMTAKLAAFNLQLLQPGEVPLETIRNITLNGDVEAKVRQNFHDPSISATRPELISKYVEPLTDPLWDRGLLHFYKSLQGEVQPGEQLLASTLDVWRGPSMIITGDVDPTIPTQSSVYVAEEMEGRLVVMESCAHIPMDEKPDVFTSAVLSFANSEEVRNAWVADGASASAKSSW